MVVETTSISLEDEVEIVFLSPNVWSNDRHELAPRMSCKRWSRSRSTYHDERGDTLLEVLMALMVIGLVAVSMFGAFSMSIGGSARYRSFSQVDLVLRNFSEAATYQIQLASLAPAYASCALMSELAPVATSGSGITTGNILYNGTSIAGPLGSGYQPPPNYSIEIGSVSYWSTDPQTNTQGFYSNTPTNCINDSPQQITAVATGPGGVSGKLTFVVVDPNYV